MFYHNLYFIASLIIIAISYFIVKRKFEHLKMLGFRLKAQPIYFAKFVVTIQILVIILGLIFSYSFLPSHHIPTAFVVMASIKLAMLIVCLFTLSTKFEALKFYERIYYLLLVLSSSISILVTLAIVMSILFEALRFFTFVNFFDFIFGLKWEPENLAVDGAYQGYGFIPVFAGTMLVTLIAMAISVPLGLLSAIYLTEYSSKKFRNLIKPILEILAGIPTVVYGYFAALFVGPLVRDLGESFNLNVSSESALAAGLVMGIMIIPFILSLSDDVLNAVPQSLRDASYALGATKCETAIRILLPASLPGIMGAVLLGISRAIGETMIVTMASGLTANLTLNPLDSVTTVTAQVMNLLLGDQEFDSPKTLAAFALGLILFIVTLFINIYALLIVKKYREKYE